MGYNDSVSPQEPHRESHAKISNSLFQKPKMSLREKTPAAWCSTKSELYEALDQSVLRDHRFRRDVECLFKVGPRAIYEFLVAVGAERSLMTYLEERIREFASLDADLLTALNANKLPSAPISEVSR